MTSVHEIKFFVKDEVLYVALFGSPPLFPDEYWIDNIRAEQLEISELPDGLELEKKYRVEDLGINSFDNTKPVFNFMDQYAEEAWKTDKKLFIKNSLRSYSDINAHLDISDIYKADISKLHSEINQYINQRLIIVTTSITLFGVVTGWIITNIYKNSQLNITSISLNLSSILLIFFSIMVWYSQAMVQQQHILSTYLVNKGFSDWENNYQEFLKDRRSDKSRCNKLIDLIYLQLPNFSGYRLNEEFPLYVFFILGAITGIITCIIMNLPCDPTNSAHPNTISACFNTITDRDVYIFYICLFIFFLVWLFAWWTRRFNEFRRDATRRWRNTSPRIEKSASRK